MEANIVVTGAMALVAGGLGLWSLVVTRKEKPRKISDAEREKLWEEWAKKPAPPMVPVSAPEPKWPSEMIQSLALTNERIEAATQALVQPRPELEALVEEMRRPVPPPDFTPLAAPLDQMQATLTKLVAQGEQPREPQQVEFPQIERQLASLTQQLQRLANARGIPPSSEEPRTLPPATHSGTPINLTQFNTVALLENVVYDCYPSEPDVYVLNIFNLGPAPVLMRSDADPFFGDIHSSILPPQSGFNRLHVPESINLLADVGGAVLSVTLQTTAV